MTGKRPRATCSVCRRVLAVSSDGTMHAHSGCLGSRRPPEPGLVLLQSRVRELCTKAAGLLEKAPGPIRRELRAVLDHLSGAEVMLMEARQWEEDQPGQTYLW